MCIVGNEEMIINVRNICWVKIIHFAQIFICSSGVIINPLYGFAHLWIKPILVYMMMEC